METKFYYCAACHEIEQYVIYSDGDTDISRGEFLVHGEFMTTGFKTREAAQAYADSKRGEQDRQEARAAGKADWAAKPCEFHASECHKGPRYEEPACMATVDMLEAIADKAEATQKRMAQSGASDAVATRYAITQCRALVALMRTWTAA